MFFFNTFLGSSLLCKPWTTTHPGNLQLSKSTGIFPLDGELTALQGDNVLGVVWAIPKIRFLGFLSLVVTTQILWFPVELNANGSYGITNICCPGTWLLTLELYGNVWQFNLLGKIKVLYW